MPIFDHFRKSGSKKSKSQPMDRQQLFAEIESTIIEADSRSITARREIDRDIAQAREAITRNDAAGKAIAFNRLSMNLGLYRYMTALRNTLRFMESNLQMRDVTQNFADLVHRISGIKVPADKVDFTRLTAEALKGLKPMNLLGIEQMAKSLIDNSMSAVSVASMPEAYLENLVAGKVTLDDLLATAAAPNVSAQPAQASQTAEATAPAHTDDSAESLSELLDKFTSVLQNGG